MLPSLIALLVASAFAAEPDLHRGKPDIWGVWLGTGGYPDIDPRYRNTPWPNIEFTAWGAAESKRLTTPDTPDECMPYGPMAYMNGNSLFPFEIVKAAKGLALLYEPSPVPRRIYTDGRKHPEDLDPTWLGHSVGRWDGETLVVDTVGTNGRGRPLNGYVAAAVNSKTDNAPRLPVSDRLHMVERIRLVGRGEYPRGRDHNRRSENVHPFVYRQTVLAAPSGSRRARVFLRRESATRRRGAHWEQTMSAVRRLLFLAAVMMLGSGSAWGHHSFAMFDLEKEMMLEGVVKDFQWSQSARLAADPDSRWQGRHHGMEPGDGCAWNADANGLEEQHAQAA